MANENIKDSYAILKTLLNENTKRFVTFDGANRPQYVYVAKSSAKPGDVALLTEYVYINPTSYVILAQKETNSTWDLLSAGWDANFTT